LPTTCTRYPVRQCGAAIKSGLIAFGSRLITVPPCPPAVGGRVFPSQRCEPIRFRTFTDRVSQSVERAKFADPFPLIAGLGGDVPPQALQIPLVGSLIPFVAVDIALFAVNIPLIPIDITLVGILVALSGVFIPLVGVLIAHLNGFTMPGFVVAPDDIFGNFDHLNAYLLSIATRRPIIARSTKLLRVLVYSTPRPRTYQSVLLQGLPPSPGNYSR
jgi:hypothetical protein